MFVCLIFFSFPCFVFYFACIFYCFVIFIVYLLLFCLYVAFFLWIVVVTVDFVIVVVVVFFFGNFQFLSDPYKVMGELPDIRDLKVNQASPYLYRK